MTAGWFESVREQFESAISLPPGWDTYYGVPSSLSSVERALSFLVTHLQRNSVPPTVVPLSDGGIQLVWHQKALDVEATFPPAEDGEVYVRDLASGTETEVGLASRGNDLAVLREAFQRLTD